MTKREKMIKLRTAKATLKKIWYENDLKENPEFEALIYDAFKAAEKALQHALEH